MPIPIMAQWMRAFKECSNATQTVILEMIDIISDPSADKDDQEMATATFLEALFPSSYDGKPGIDIEDWESLHREQCADATQVELKLDKEEQAFGDRVQSLMKSKGMTQELLASKAGLTQPAISMLINRGARPQKRTVARIAEALGVMPDELWPQ